MKLNKIYVYFISIYLGIFVCFSYIFGKDRTILLGGVILLLGYIVLKNIKKDDAKLKLYKSDIILSVLIILMSISMIYSIELDLSLRYVQIFIMLFIIKICTQNIEENFFKIITNVLLVLSLVHVLATHVYTIYPDFISKINSLIMSQEQYEYNESLMRYGANAGICPDHSLNATYITIFIMIIYSNILTNKSSKKIINYIFLILGLIALMYTGKRGFAVANVLALVITTIFYLRKKGKIVKKLFYYIIFLCVAVFIILQFPATQILIERFTGSDGTTLLNGREDIYSKVEKNIEENFFLGSGINTTQIITEGNDAHNTYLQILSELGIVGFILYIILFSYNYFNGMKLENYNEENKDMFLSISLYYQTFFLAYSMTGNPLYNPVSILIYFIVIIFNQKSSKKEKINESRNINIP